MFKVWQFKHSHIYSSRWLSLLFKNRTLELPNRRKQSAWRNQFEASRFPLPSPELGATPFLDLCTASQCHPRVLFLESRDRSYNLLSSLFIVGRRRLLFLSGSSFHGSLLSNVSSGLKEEESDTCSTCYLCQWSVSYTCKQVPVNYGNLLQRISSLPRYFPTFICCFFHSFWRYIVSLSDTLITKQ